MTDDPTLPSSYFPRMYPLFQFEMSKANIESQSDLFRRCVDHIDPSIPLTIVERRHAIDIVLGICVSMLYSSTTVDQLSPILNYISFSVDLEWKAGTASKDERPDTVVFDANRAERQLATTKTCVALLFLIQSRPPVPGLYESLTSYLSSKDAVGGWILCCLVNTTDDFLRSLGMRLLTSFLEVAFASSSSPGVDKVIEGAGRDVSVKPSQNTHKGKITKTMKAVGSGLGISSSHMLSAVLQSHSSMGIAYKLLWHLLKVRTLSEVFDRQRICFGGTIRLPPLCVSRLLSFDTVPPGANRRGITCRYGAFAIGGGYPDDCCLGANSPFTRGDCCTRHVRSRLSLQHGMGYQPTVDSSACN